MLALLVSVFIVAYVVVPGVVFRSVFSFFVPLRAFDRTRTQELAYSVVVCAAPFLVALWLVQHTCVGWWPFSFADTWAQRDADYKAVLLACFGDRFAGSADELWSAAMRSSKRQGRLLFWYSGLVGVEALVLGVIASKWGTLQPKLVRHAWADRLLARLLLRNISEWHVLFTNFLFPGTTIFADKVCTLNIRPQTTLAAATRLVLELDPDATVTVKTVTEPPPKGPPVSAQAEPAAESQSGQEPPAD